LNRPKVVITRRIPEEALNLIKEQADVFIWDYEEEPIPKQVLLEESKDAAGIFTNVGDPIDQELFEHAPLLKVVSTMAVGFDNIDINEATKRGIRVGHTPGILTETTADLTFALLMATARRISEADTFTRDGKWMAWSPMLMTGQDIFGAVIGIIGMGRIGEGVARRAAGFNMKIVYHSRTRYPETEQSLNARYLSLDELLQESDYVVMLAPSTKETFHMIGERELGLMKPNSILINASRGTNVDEEALYHALKKGGIWAAGLDVFEKEPVTSDHPLLSLQNVVATPHIGSATIATRTKMAVLAAQNLLLGLEEGKLIHSVNS
jgi:glyoxylate reductase